ncbi:hypothetical protein Patl1_00982 [Pistacia atlantica]|uniref:Uncharacterized protein n=1 Tax=Pistacia atlantica TaxID=434234 RepID=A0ACC1CBW5_9ROSI|nr:hypothetical protein Patl1_00982 [Pistacia atlantica]
MKRSKTCANKTLVRMNNLAGSIEEDKLHAPTDINLELAGSKSSIMDQKIGFYVQVFISRRKIILATKDKKNCSGRLLRGQVSKYQRWICLIDMFTNRIISKLEKTLSN